MKKNIIVFIILIFVLSICYGETEYKIGDVGPAGGIICYVDENDQYEDWKYIEAAPVDQSNGITWGKRKNIGSLSTEIGSGKENTEKIVKALGKGNYAAKICYDFVYKGYNDWFLPSRDELDLIYNKLYFNKIGDFTEGKYWTSSENDKKTAWYIWFIIAVIDPPLNIETKTKLFRVRAIRYF